MTRRLIINGRFLGGERTAVNNVAWALTAELCAKQGPWEVEVAVPRSLADVNVPSHWNMRVAGRRSGVLWDQLELPKLCQDGVVAGFFNTVPLRGHGCVTMLHDAHVFALPQSYPTLTRLWRQILSRRAGVPGNHVLTVSDHSKRALQAYGIGSPDKIGIVPNGPGPVAASEPDLSMLGCLGLERNLPFCLGVASLLPHKNVGVLIRAFAMQELKHVKLVLFGKDTRNGFEGAGHAVPPNVVFAGAVNDAALAALYQAATAVCIPATAEGFGLPALEAMAFGKPTVIAPCGALPEVVGSAGLTAAPSDPQAWTDAVVKLVTDKALWDRLSAKATERAAFFTWEAAGRAFWGHLDRWYPA